MTDTSTMTATVETRELSENQKRVAELHAQVEQGVNDIISGGKLQNYLDVMAKVDLGYSNNVLVMQQQPEATLFKGYNDWQKNGRQVKKSPTSLKVLAPTSFYKTEDVPKVNSITGKPVMGEDGKQATEEKSTKITYFTPVTVFDVSQTYGKKLPKIDVPELNGNVKDYDLFFKALQESTPYNVILGEVENNGRGKFNSGRREITVNENMDEVNIVQATIRGITNITLHDMNAASGGNVERDTISIQAEMIAYAVCKHYGVEPPALNAERVAEWGVDKEMPEMREMLKTVHNTSNDFINNIDSKILEIAKERNPELLPETPPPEAETSKKLAVFGNAKYSEFNEKAFINVKTEDVPKLVAKLEAEGIKFSGIENDNRKSTVTVAPADKEKVQQIEKNLNIIGNTSFKDIVDRKYFDFDNNTAQKIAAELETQGVEYTGREKGNKTTLVVGAADVAQFKEIEKAITGQGLIAESPDVPISSTPPEVSKATPPPPDFSEIPPPSEPPPIKEANFQGSLLQDEKAAEPVKPEKTAQDKTDKTEKAAPKKEKPSITGRIKKDAAVKKAAPKKDEPKNEKAAKKDNQAIE